MELLYQIETGQLICVADCFKVRNFCKTKFHNFLIFGKFVKVWNCKIFDFVAFAKVNSSKNVQFFGPESYLW